MAFQLGGEAGVACVTVSPCRRGTIGLASAPTVTVKRTRAIAKKRIAAKTAKVNWGDVFATSGGVHIVPQSVYMCGILPQV